MVWGSYATNSQSPIFIQMAITICGSPRKETFKERQQKQPNWDSQTMYSVSGIKQKMATITDTKANIDKGKQVSTQMVHI